MSVCVRVPTDRQNESKQEARPRVCFETHTYTRTLLAFFLTFFLSPPLSPLSRSHSLSLWPVPPSSSPCFPLTSQRSSQSRARMPQPASQPLTTQPTAAGGSAGRSESIPSLSRVFSSVVLLHSPPPSWSLTFSLVYTHSHSPTHTHARHALFASFFLSFFASPPSNYSQQIAQSVRRRLDVPQLGACHFGS